MKEPKAKLPEVKAAKILKKMDKKADAGGLWVSSLDTNRKYQLMDYSSQLSQLIPFSQSGITEEDFVARLVNVGHYDSALKVLKKLVGDLNGLVGPYEIFWSHRYTHYFVGFLRRGLPEEEARASTASRMELSQTELLTKISRRDINSLLNLFLMKSAEETEGHIAMGVAIRASEGSVKDTELFYKYVRRKEADLGGERELDPSLMTEDELLSHIKKMKKQMGFAKETIRVENLEE